VRLKLNGTHQFLAYADDVNLLGDNENSKTFIDTCRELSVEMKAEKTQCVLLSRHQNAEQNRDIKTESRSF
jgi:hypothetical protein